VSLAAERRRRLAAAGLDPEAVAALAAATVAEDTGPGGDVTSRATVPAGMRSGARFTPRAAGVLAGVDVAAAVVETVCATGAARVQVCVEDGGTALPGVPVLWVEAPTRDLLTAERSALNLLCHLSGVASLTRRWADALGPGPTRVRDTRKTLPGLRALQKYAVRCGGGLNHRMGLWDAALVKDNHVVAAGGLTEAFARVRAAAPDVPLEIEVDDLEGLREVLAAGADLVLLDNFSPAQMAAAVAVRDAEAPGALLEASGGLTLADAPAVAASGVDYVAVGELTHSARVLDIGLDLLPA